MEHPVLPINSAKPIFSLPCAKTTNKISRAIGDSPDVKISFGINTDNSAGASI
jgi:hypothetical protein